MSSVTSAVGTSQSVPPQEGFRELSFAVTRERRSLFGSKAPEFATNDQVTLVLRLEGAPKEQVANAGGLFGSAGERVAQRTIVIKGKGQPFHESGHKIKVPSQVEQIAAQLYFIPAHALAGGERRAAVPLGDTYRFNEVTPQKDYRALCHGQPISHVTLKLIQKAGVEAMNGERADEHTFDPEQDQVEVRGDGHPARGLCDFFPDQFSNFADFMMTQYETLTEKKKEE